MEMGRRGIIHEGKQPFNQLCRDLRGLTAKDKKLWLREAKATRNTTNGEVIYKKGGKTL